MTFPSRTASTPAFSWHPKITPYRLIFITITCGLGITKAVLVAHGQVTSSVTVEWITGVVMALSFQFLGAYEYKNHRSEYIDWMFDYDCLTVFNILLNSDCEDQRAQTRSGHAANADFTPSLPAIVTAYRLLVSITVSIFGIAKMVCGYLGLSLAMKTFDWIAAVPLVLGLYYIGLYEEKQSAVPRILFDVEYSSYARLCLYFTGGFTLCFGWLCTWIILLDKALNSSSAMGQEWKNMWNACGLRAVQGMEISFCLGMLQIGVWGVGIILRPIIQACNGRNASSFRKYNDHMALLILYLLSAIFFISLCLVGPFSAAQVIKTIDDSLPRPFRIILAGMMLCSTAVPAQLAYGFLIMTADVYNRAPLNLRAAYQKYINR